jgi:hypothetical protein
MSTATTTVRGVVPGTKLRVGSLIMVIGGAGFIGYAIIFFIRDFTGFLELGIGRGEVSVSTTQIKHFGPSLHDYISHLHIALSGFIAASGLAVPRLEPARRESAGSGPDTDWGATRGVETRESRRLLHLTCEILPPATPCPAFGRTQSPRCEK